MIVATVCYKAGISFDEAYYLDKHMPMVSELLTPLGLKRTEVRKVLGTADGSPAPYQVVTSVYFDSMEAFQAATQTPQFKEIVTDISNFYQSQPDILVTNVALATSV